MAKRGSMSISSKQPRAAETPRHTAAHALAASDPMRGSSLSPDVPSQPPIEGDLRALEARYQALVLATGQITWISRPDGNGGWERDGRDWRLFTGQDHDEAGGWGWLEAVHPDDRERVRAAWEAAVAAHRTYEIDYRVRRHDGEYRWLLVRGVPVLAADGSVREWVGTATDITERKRAEEREREREAQLAAELADVEQLQRISSQLLRGGDLDALYQQILDAAIAVMRSDMGSMQMLYPERNELRLLAWKGFDPASAAFWEWVGVEAGSTCGVALDTGERVVVPDVETCDFMAGTQDLDFYRLSGIRAVQSTPLVSRDGRLVGMISTHWRVAHQPAARELRLLDVLARQAADLIERRRVEAAAAHLAAIVTSAEDAIASKTLDGIVTSWNASAERMFGYTAQDMVGQSILRIIPPDRYQEEDQILARIRAGERIEHFATVRLTKDGCPIDVSLTISPIRDSAGRVIGASKIARDITERKRMEEAVRESEEKFRTLADNMPALAWMARPDGHIFWYNRRWYEYTGTTPESQEGWGWRSAHEPAALPQVMEQWQHSLATGEPFEMVFPLRGADGEYRPFLTRVTPLKDERGCVTRWFGTNIDISQQRATEEALLAANQLMDEFLHMATHELKTPLTALQANLQIGERRIQRLLAGIPEPTVEGEAADPVREAIQGVAQILGRNQRQVRRLTRLVDDLVDSARIQAGKLEIVSAPCDLAAIVREAVAEQRAVHPEREIRLQLPRSLPTVPVEADADRIGQVVTNYLTNALKYSPDDQPVELALHVEGTTARLSVRDEGPGIPAEDQARIWERGFRVAGITPSGEGVVGLGLGLHISREIVERHGGRVGVESAPGKGSTFWFTLPRPRNGRG